MGDEAMIEAVHRASAPGDHSSSTAQRTIIAIGAIVMVVAIFLALAHRWSADSLSGKLAAQPVSIAARAPRGPSAQLSPPSLQKNPAAPVDPTRARGAWDFTGPEFHGPARRNLSMTLSGEALTVVEAAWNSGDYAKAAALVMTWPELDDRRQILRPVLSDWMETSPLAAAEFAQTLPAGVERREMLEAVIHDWCERDVAAAGAWLNALARHADQDGAVAAIATSSVLSEQRPEIALSWAESIGAPTARWEAAATVAEVWARRDLAAVVRYFEKSSTLTIDERARLLTYVRQSAVTVK
jgi:hypothetical protein